MCYTISNRTGGWIRSGFRTAHKGGKTVRKRIPSHVLPCVVWIAGGQLLVYYGTRLFPAPAPYDLSTALDRSIPLVPAWITVYFLAYATWIAGFWRIVTSGRSRAVRVSFAYGAALLLCGICFVLFPCTMERPEVVGSDLFSNLIRFLYLVDPPRNLLPSIHVLASYFCWRGMTGCRTIPLRVKTVYFVFCILVCLSILFVRQHVLWDISAAVADAELMLFLSKILRPERFGRHGISRKSER